MGLTNVDSLRKGGTEVGRGYVFRIFREKVYILIYCLKYPSGPKST